MTRNHYPIPSKIVFVRGNIFLTHKNNKGMLDNGACFVEKDIDNIDEIIEGDFTIDDNTVTSEDTYYYASGDVVAYETNTGGFYSRYHLIMDYDTAIDNILKLSRLDVDFMDKRLLNRLLFANVYALMESFLQDTCGYFVMRNQKYKELFLQNHKSLKIEKFPLCQIYDKYNQIDHKIENAINNTVYHRLSEEIQPLFEGTFGIEFPDYTFISKNLEIRHDIIHRNGESKKRGIIHEIKNNDLYELIEHVDKFVHGLFSEFEKLEYGTVAGPESSAE